MGSWGSGGTATTGSTYVSDSQVCCGVRGPSVERVLESCGGNVRLGTSVVRRELGGKRDGWLLQAGGGAWGQPSQSSFPGSRSWHLCPLYSLPSVFTVLPALTPQVPLERQPCDSSVPGSGTQGQVASRGPASLWLTLGCGESQALTSSGEEPENFQCEALGGATCGSCPSTGLSQTTRLLCAVGQFYGREALLSSELF